MDQPHPPQPALPLNQPAIPPAEHPIPAEAGEQELPAGFRRFPWQEALELPKEEPAPPCLKEHVRGELVGLFNIWYDRTRREAFVEKAIAPLNLDMATVGFCEALLERVDELQRFHYNNGNHIPYAFKKKKEREQLYSIILEYAASVPATDPDVPTGEPGNHHDHSRLKYKCSFRICKVLVRIRLVTKPLSYKQRGAPIFLLDG